MYSNTPASIQKASRRRRIDFGRIPPSGGFPAAKLGSNLVLWVAAAGNPLVGLLDDGTGSVPLMNQTFASRGPQAVACPTAENRTHPGPAPAPEADFSP